MGTIGNWELLIFYRSLLDLTPRHGWHSGYILWLLGGNTPPDWPATGVLNCQRTTDAGQYGPSCAAGSALLWPPLSSHG